MARRASVFADGHLLGDASSCVADAPGSRANETSINGEAAAAAAAAATPMRQRRRLERVNGCAIVPLVPRHHGGHFELVEQLLPVIDDRAVGAGALSNGNAEDALQQVLSEALCKHREFFASPRPWAANGANNDGRCGPRGIDRALAKLATEVAATSIATSDDDDEAQPSEGAVAVSDPRAAVVEWSSGSFGVTLDTAGILAEHHARATHFLHLPPIGAVPLQVLPTTTEGRCREQLRRLREVRAGGVLPAWRSQAASRAVTAAAAAMPQRISILSARPQFCVDSGSACAPMSYLVCFAGRPHENSFMTLEEIAALYRGSGSGKNGGGDSAADARSTLVGLPRGTRKMVLRAALAAMWDMLRALCEAMALMLRCRRGGALRATLNPSLLEAIVWYERQPPVAALVRGLTDSGVLAPGVCEADLMTDDFWAPRLPQWEEARRWVASHGRVMAFADVEAMFALNG